MKEGDILIVGAGISGLTVAERLASTGKKVLIIDKRNHIGGNCYDFYNKEGLLVPLYGPHYFHTNDEGVWKYVNKFSEWLPYKLKVLSNINKNLFVPLPANIKTVNMIFGMSINNEEKFNEWLEKEIEDIKNPKNSEEVAISTMGKRLYNLLIKNYIKKQWGIHPRDLDPEVMNRIIIRKNFIDNYFLDKYQGIPKQGYASLFNNMINNSNITLRLNTNFFDLNHENFKIIVFTGKIDSFFKNKGLRPLQYRSLKFKFETLNKEFFQPETVIAYPNTKKFTRITEHKHATGQKHEKTTIIKEYPLWNGEPYYPIPSEKNRKLYKKYEKLAKQVGKRKIYFIGRLGQYKYLNMDQAFRNAMDFYEKIKESI